jgi:hypothetical protein
MFAPRVTQRPRLNGPASRVTHMEPRKENCFEDVPISKLGHAPWLCVNFCAVFGIETLPLSRS